MTFEQPTDPAVPPVTQDAGGATTRDAAGTVAEPLPRKRLAMLVVVAVAILAADLAAKIAIVATMDDGQRIPLLGDLVSLYLIRNPGAAFSLATGMTWVLTLVAVGVVVGIARFARRLRSRGWAVALGLVLGGATGNLVDRFFRGPGPLRGHVVDYVSVGWWPVFNVADSAIVVGGILLVSLALLGRDIDGTSPVEPPAPDPDELDPDDEKLARRDRPKYPSRRWDPMPGTPRHLTSTGPGAAAGEASGAADREGADDLIDEDDRLPGRTRHPATKWERG